MQSVSEWLRSIGFPEHIEAFENNNIGQDELFGLSDENLKELGVLSIGHRQKIFSEIRKLNRRNIASKALTVHDAAVSFIGLPAVIGFIGTMTLGIFHGVLLATMKGYFQRNTFDTGFTGLMFGLSVALTLWVMLLLFHHWRKRKNGQHDAKIMAFLFGVGIPLAFSAIVYDSIELLRGLLFVSPAYISIFFCFHKILKESERAWWVLVVPILFYPTQCFLHADERTFGYAVLSVLAGGGFLLMGILFRYGIARKLKNT